MGNKAKRFGFGTCWSVHRAISCWIPIGRLVDVGRSCSWIVWWSCYISDTVLILSQAIFGHKTVTRAIFELLFWSFLEIPNDIWKPSNHFPDQYPDSKYSALFTHCSYDSAVYQIWRSCQNLCMNTSIHFTSSSSGPTPYLARPMLKTETGPSTNSRKAEIRPSRYRKHFTTRLGLGFESYIPILWLR